MRNEMYVRVLFVSSTSGIFFNPRADAVTDHIQSANDITPYIRCQLHVDELCNWRPILILPSARVQKLISAVGGIRTYNMWTVDQRLTTLTTELSPLHNVLWIHITWSSYYCFVSIRWSTCDPSFFNLQNIFYIVICFDHFKCSYWESTN